jgi:hypothetical protein
MQRPDPRPDPLGADASDSGILNHSNRIQRELFRHDLDPVAYEREDFRHGRCADDEKFGGLRCTRVPSTADAFESRSDFETMTSGDEHERSASWLPRVGPGALLGSFSSTDRPRDSGECPVHQLRAIQTYQERPGYAQNSNGLGMPLHPSILRRR